MYISSLVNTCTSQAGPLRVKGNQLLPPPLGLHLPSLVRLFGSYRYKNKLHDAVRRGHVGPYSTLILLLLMPFVNTLRNGWHYRYYYTRILKLWSSDDSKMILSDDTKMEVGKVNIL